MYSVVFLTFLFSAIASVAQAQEVGARDPMRDDELDRKRWRAGDPYYRPGKPWDPEEAYDLFRLAAVVDPALNPIADQLKDRHTIKDKWFSAVCRALALDAPSGVETDD